jgi:hypothetical protein
MAEDGNGVISMERTAPTCSSDMKTLLPQKMELLSSVDGLTKVVNGNITEWILSTMLLSQRRVPPKM